MHHIINANVFNGKIYHRIYSQHVSVLDKEFKFVAFSKLLVFH